MPRKGNKLPPHERQNCPVYVKEATQKRVYDMVEEYEMTNDELIRAALSAYKGERLIKSLNKTEVMHDCRATNNEPRTQDTNMPE